MRPAFEKKEPRLKLMDIQGVEAAVVHAGGFENEPAFRGGDVDLGYAVTRAWNEYVLEDWGFNTEDRIFCPLHPVMEVHRLSLWWWTPRQSYQNTGRGHENPRRRPDQPPP